MGCLNRGTIQRKPLLFSNNADNNSEVVRCALCQSYSKEYLVNTINNKSTNGGVKSLTPNTERKYDLYGAY